MFALNNAVCDIAWCGVWTCGSSAVSYHMRSYPICLKCLWCTKKTNLESILFNALNHFLIEIYFLISGHWSSFWLLTTTNSFSFLFFFLKYFFSIFFFALWTSKNKRIKCIGGEKKTKCTSLESTKLRNSSSFLLHPKFKEFLFYFFFCTKIDNQNVPKNYRDFKGTQFNW